MPTASLFEYIGAKIEEPTLTPEELEFFAEHEKVVIIPNFSLNLPSSKLSCVEGTYGPFRPNIPVDVPLYLALALHRRGKCRIQPPPWMASDKLKEVLEEERSISQYFQPVPQYYVEVSKMLFTEARAIFGSNNDVHEVQDLIEELKKVRNSKILDGLRKVSGPITVKLNNLSASESNKIRLLFENSLNMWHQLAKNDKEWQEGRMAGTDTPATL
ncbi:DNA replication complex GINS protein PSF2 [Tetrabaena socialis]|uniref:DNA replication complex GINS protein PSF2 n=1 Tax=Tetrabaena socialis TaxID=47790 RepID=A0A2J8AD79_9CHLO|nr:DNA replication complex GINS protein PSF2 [Tetrabaena socialis]|eukprot:PNH10467.1 DNA replication complex GINS protein PSF2 [Tetrabaena socialis]